MAAAVLCADRVIAAPRIVGRAIAGVPGSWYGFVPVDDRGRVEGLHGVYAAGDMTTFPVKQGGLAAQQADAIAADIAAHLGVGDGADPPAPVLRARLVGSVPSPCTPRSPPTAGRSTRTSTRRPIADQRRPTADQGLRALPHALLAGLPAAH